MAKLISGVYGDALFETAAEHGRISQIYDEVLEFTKVLMQNQEFLRILSHQAISREEKLRSLEACVKGSVSEELIGFLHVVVEKNRQNDLLPMFRHFTDKVKEYRKTGIAYVTSAVELSQEQKKRLEERLLDTTDYVEYQMYYTVDPSILGGMIIRVGDRVVDNSIKTRLNILQCQLSGLQLTIEGR